MKATLVRHKQSLSTMVEMTMSIAQPNNTVYVSNIDWNVKKPLLRRALYSLFSRHGKVLEVITLRREGLRGQAFIVFDDVQASTSAIQAENGASFFGKELKLNYAKEKSDRITKRDGSYVPKNRRVKQKVVADHDTPTPQLNDPEIVKAPPLTQAEPPSRILLAQDLPVDCNTMMLEMLFRQYSGYQEVRQPREGLAFIEFDDEPHATLALKGLKGFKLTTKDILQLKYGKA